MSLLPKNASTMIGSLIKEGAFIVFAANAVNKFALFISNILIVNFMTKDDYGIFSYANNLFAFALLITGFCLLPGLLQFCSEKRPEEEKESIQKYVLLRGTAIDSLLAFLLLVIGLFIALPIDDAGYCVALLAPILILDFAHQFVIVVLRTKKQNRTFALLQNINSISYATFSCLGAYLGGIIGLVLGRYFAYFLSLIFDIVFCRRYLKFFIHVKRLADKLKKELWRYVLLNGAASVINQIIYIADIFLIGLLLREASLVATYRVATALPEGLLLVSGSALLFAVPYFAANNQNGAWQKKYSNLMLLALAAVNGIAAILLFIFAPQLIELLWGSSYLDAVVILRILAVSYFFDGSLRVPSANLLACLRKVEFNLTISIVFGILHIVSLVIFVNLFGIIGAAFNTMFVILLKGSISTMYLRRTVNRMIS